MGLFPALSLVTHCPSVSFSSDDQVPAEWQRHRDGQGQDHRRPEDQSGQVPATDNQDQGHRREETTPVLAVPGQQRQGLRRVRTDGGHLQM